MMKLIKFMITVYKLIRVYISNMFNKICFTRFTSDNDKNNIINLRLFNYLFIISKISPVHVIVVETIVLKKKIFVYM